MAHPSLWKLLMIFEFSRVTCPPLIPSDPQGRRPVGCSWGGCLSLAPLPEASCEVPEANAGFDNRLFFFCVLTLFSRRGGARDSFLDTRSAPRSISYSCLLIDLCPARGQLTCYTWMCRFLRVEWRKYEFCLWVDILLWKSPQVLPGFPSSLFSVPFSASFLLLFSSKPNTRLPGWPWHRGPCLHALGSQGEHPKAQYDHLLHCLAYNLPTSGFLSWWIWHSQPFVPARCHLATHCTGPCLLHLSPHHPDPVASSSTPAVPQLTALPSTKQHRGPWSARARVWWNVAADAPDAGASTRRPHAAQDGLECCPTQNHKCT